MIPSCFATRDHGFEKKVISLFDKRSQINVTIERDDKHSLIRILSRVWVLDNIKQSIRVNRYNDALERHAARSLELLVFFGTPARRFHSRVLSGCVPFVTVRID